MQRSMSPFWQRNTRTNDYVTSEEKDNLVESGEVFAVQNVREGVGNFGPRWLLTILRQNGRVQTLSFGKNPERDVFMSALQEECQGVGNVDCSLDSFATPNGFAYTLIPPRTDEPDF